MKIIRMKLTKEKLERMPPKDRTLLLLMGNISNEINILQKLMLMVRKQDAPLRVVDIVEAGQVVFFMRTLVGKVHEAYLLLEKRVTGDKYFVDRYGLRGEWAGKDQLKDVNRYFAKWGTLISAVRNSVAFHSSDKEGLVERSFVSLAAEEPWDFFLADTDANSFYYASELVVTISIPRVWLTMRCSRAGSAAIWQ